ncbi:MAG: hypothetical protein FGM21_15015 [Limnohabitans sp.]|nr:hypothetical protein [Limnohabitans sp.]
MKSYWLGIFISCFSIVSYAGLFGPASYEECLLENVKNAKTNDAVNAIALACEMKFPAKVETPKSRSVKVCQIYWDGWKFVEGDRPNSSYMTLEHTFLGAKALELSIPRAMGKYLEVEKDTSGPDLDYKSKYGKFFSENYGQIRRLCAFN